MVIKVFVSGISASKEVKKHQQRVFMILDSLKLSYETIDITEPGKEDQRTYMRENCKKGAGGGVLPPQFFNDEDYLGDYEDFELANEDDELMKFLKLEDQVSKEDITSTETKFQATEPENADELIFQNGTGSREVSEPKEEVTESSKKEVTEEENVSEEHQAATEEEPETKEA
ncbi:SH3 domain-binding glutamic acid-rich protein homolog isoform X2 [Limulus polyphemus]|uniref:SH3 domain-binding glutamic acid-rich protein homolog isoform X2 n=1 Tax=Limulus polyphemus TaxID=6850 RepID=A0ABM1BLL4_LIMPO|nr:SH3 domain-binding glutamic acid-rich protein homolog isoform X2 [Limulus polyphemus]